MNSTSAAEIIQVTDGVAQTAQERRRFWLFMAFALIYLGLGIGLRDPWPSDEPRFTLAAQQMVESGDWMFPHRGTELYPDKPPMLMWMEAASFEVLRNWRIAFLLPSLLAALLTLALTYDLGRRLWNPQVGLYAACALLTVFQFVYQCKRAQIDPLVMGWITLANWGLLLHFLRGPNWRAYWLACFAAGLGVITKGVGFLALLMFVPYLWARWRHWDGVTRTTGSALRWLGGALAFLAAIALWLLPMLLSAKARGTPEYAEYVNNILFHQTAQRYAGTWSHPQPFWYYVPVVLLGWLPLSLGYIGAAPRWWRDLQAGDARLLLPLAWSAMLLLFFSVPSGKRDVYLMPALPMVALAMAPYLQEIIAARWLRTTAFAMALLGGLLFAAIGLSALTGHPPRSIERLVQQRDLGNLTGMLWYMLIAIGSLFVAAAAWLRPRRGVQALLIGIGGLWLVWSLWAYPLLNDSSSAAGVMRHAGRIIGPDAELGLVAWKEQNLLMADRPVHDFGFMKPTPQQFIDATQWQAQAPQRRWIFVLDSAMGDCVDRARAVSVGHANRRDWWLFRADAVKPGCVPVIAAQDPGNDAGF
jgi:4-amino-4-deoxy-L-arabinose transferase-like glycosyltransferase